MTSNLELPHVTSDCSAISVADIVEHARKPGRYLLTLSDNRTFTVSVSLLADLSLTRNGVALTGDTLARLKSEADILRVMDKALASISRARRTRRELEQRLRRTRPGVEPPAPNVVAEALDRLAASGILSDEAVARAEASSRLRRGDAPRRVAMILQQKGIGRTDAASAVSLAVREDNINEDAQCMAVADKRMRALAKLEPPVARRRLMGFLLRRGYGSNSIRLAISKHFSTR
ncbi:MAG: RecX family transcriptional regulator [Phycisphaerae bacterium]|nr:RecX family transcriptional regulator [Gemmatimonadaceae bacterium]